MKKIGVLAFSPTGSTNLICKTIAESITDSNVGIIENPSGKYMSPDGNRFCLGCLACVQTCSHEERVLNASWMQNIMGKMVLTKASKIRREPLTIPPS